MPTEGQPENKKIIMFGNDWCPDVRYTRRHLQQLRVPYIEINIDQDHEAAALVEMYTGGRQRTPTLIIGKQVLIEPSDEELEDALQAEGWID